MAIMAALLMILLLYGSIRVSGNAEGDALIEFKTSLNPSDALGNWDPALQNPCTWFHIQCDDDNRVIRVDLGNKALSGTLVPSLGRLSQLQYLELYDNNIVGEIPSELGDLSELLSLDLYQNNLTGTIPDSLGRLSKLRFLRLNDNSLNGSIPMSLTNLNLRVLELSNNDLSGSVPTNGSFSLFTPISFANNHALCGQALNKQCPGGPPLIPSYVAPPSTEQNNGSNTGAIVGGIVAGVALVVAVPAIGFALWKRRSQPEVYYDVPDEESDLRIGQLKRFSLGELQVATDGFSNKNILGKGGFGKVYKGRLSDGSLVAVKRLKEDRNPAGELQFQTEVEMISLAVHRNLLRLRGFCMTPTERLLVYPFMANRSLASRLRERNPGDPSLDWATRKRIALGAAKGLAYLHDHCDPRIIHRDVKAANILLDDEFEAVVGDFGLAKLMDYKDSHVITKVVGTFGYIPPESISTGKASEKTDVFGYGVMLLELVTGQMALDLSRLADDEDIILLNWVKRLLGEQKLGQILDPNIGEKFDMREVERVIRVALLCTEVSARDRPKMADVVRMMEGDGLSEQWEEWQRVDFNRNCNTDYVPWAESTMGNSHALEVHALEVSGPR